MIDLTQIRDLVDAGADRLVFDSAGEPMKRNHPTSGGPAVLHVADVEEAVKRVDGGTIVESLNRETLWGVRWFELDSEVILELGTGTIQPGELIEAVREIGHQWQVVPVSPSDP